MDLIRSITANKAVIENLIDNSLTKSLLRTHNRCRILNNTPQEPDFVADLTINWTKELLSILKLTLHPNLEIGIASVYCHQKPIVDFGANSNPELGDILFVIKYIDNQRKEHFNSLLLQAKTTSQSNLTVGQNESHQLELYMRWPQFSYLRANGLNGQRRDIHPKTITQGAKYLMIDPDPMMTLGINGTFGFGCAIPNRHLTLSTVFTSEIIDFLSFYTGRTFSDENSITEDWSQMIWDLLRISKGKMSRRKNSGLQRFPRNPSNGFDGCGFIDMNVRGSFFGDVDISGEGNNNDNVYFKNEDNGGGVSTIMIEINENIE